VERARKILSERSDLVTCRLPVRAGDRPHGAVADRAQRAQAGFAGERRRGKEVAGAVVGAAVVDDDRVGIEREQVLVVIGASPSRPVSVVAQTALATSASSQNSELPGDVAAWWPNAIKRDPVSRRTASCPGTWPLHGQRSTRGRARPATWARTT
jgi:hypothetical protein